MFQHTGDICEKPIRRSEFKYIGVNITFIVLILICTFKRKLEQNSATHDRSSLSV